MKHKSKIIAVIIFILLSWQLEAATPPIPEQPANYVVDLAGIIDPMTEADLNRRLKALEDKTTAQVVVLTLNSLEGEPIETVSLRTAERWALGQKGKDNGVLITVAVQDRKYRIEVGYGLEAILPDSLVGSIGRECFVPNFRAGKYSEGISDAVKTITRQIIGEPIQIKEKSWWKRVFGLTFWFPGLISWLLLVIFVVLSWLKVKRSKFCQRPLPLGEEIIPKGVEGFFKLYLFILCILFFMMIEGFRVPGLSFWLLLVLVVVGIIIEIYYEYPPGKRAPSEASSGGFWGGFGGGGGGFGGFSGGGGGFGGGGCSGGW